MTQLFKEVTSPKNSDETATEKLKAGDNQGSTEASTSESATKKAKHGDPGVCCGGCS